MFTYHGKVKRVIDGDTFEIEVDLGFDVKVTQNFRILNLDTYETRLIKETTEEEKAKGIQIKNFAKELLEGKVVMLKTYLKKGFYKRYLCEVWLWNPEREKDVNYIMLPQYLGFDKKYKLNEEFDKEKYFQDTYGQEVLDLIKKHKLL